MRFFSDNAARVHPAVLAAIAAADVADTGYDGDGWSRRLDAAFSALFGREAAVLWVSTGTAANALALASLCPPHGGILCHAQAHIQNDEAGAPEFFTHGAKLLLAGGPGAKLTPGCLSAAADAIGPGVHHVQPHAVSITNASEYGQSYTPAEVAAIAGWAQASGLGLHMDGARLANAIAHRGCTPAEITSGVDVLSFGFVKNGGMSAEAIVFFRPDLAAAARIRHKRAGHLLSKGRYLAAQLLAMLEGGLWLETARAANAAAQTLARAAAHRLVCPVEANALFLRVSPAEAAALRAAGFGFYDWMVPGEIRLVCSWDQDADGIARLADALAALP
ncbi:MAG: beta-eliminating lyase-related protein [Sphingomonas fennica]